MIGIALLVLTGWLFSIPAFKTVLPGLATMKPNTALALGLIGLSLLLASIPYKNRWLKLISQGCAAFALLIGVLTLSEYAFEVDLGIDQLLFQDTSSPGNLHPGRMSPVTALNLSLLGVAAWILNRRQHRQLVQVFGCGTLLISILALVGYAYGIPSLYDFFPYSSIAMHTALAVSLLSLGILFARPKQGLMKIFSSDNSAGAMARRLMPAAIVLPFLLGWLLLAGQRMGLYDSTFQLVLFTMSTFLVFTVLIWWNAGLLQQADVVRRKAQVQLSESRDREAAILYASLDAVITIDHEGHILEFNPAAQNIFGYQRADVLGRDMSELIMPFAYRERHRKGMAKYLATGEGPILGKRIELTGMRADGSEFPLELAVTPMEGSEQTIFTGFVRDITERKQAEEELRKHAFRTQALADLSNTLAAVRLDLQAVLDVTAQHAAGLIGDSCVIRLASDDRKYLQVASLYHSTSTTLAILRELREANPLLLKAGLEGQVIQTGQPVLMPVISPEQQRSILPSAERSVWERIGVRSLLVIPLGAHGEVLGTLTLTRDGPGRPYTPEDQAFLQDIADRAALSVVNARLYKAMQQLNSELEQRVLERTAQLEAANMELESFSYSVSHDLRAPLRGIDGYSQALLEDYGEQLPAEGQKFLERIRASAQRMATLIDDLLKLSQMTRAQMKFVPVDLTGLAGEILSELQRANPERRVKWSVASNLTAHGDLRLLEAVLENLLNNAWKYTSRQERARIEFGSKQEGEETIYFVRDNGAGFDMAYADKLFGAFQRLHTASEFPGTGIGLATVQRILQRHGGRIWAESMVNEGATFFFTIPTLKAAAGKMEPKEEASIRKRAKEII